MIIQRLKKKRNDNSRELKLAKHGADALILEGRAIIQES
jgi:hypothetical protein